MLKVKNLYSPVSGREVANQFVIFDENKIVFQSYDSTICIVENGMRVTLGRHWDYSKTTSKYLYQFLRMYARYANIDVDNLSKKAIEKAIAENHIAYDENLV